MLAAKTSSDTVTVTRTFDGIEAAAHRYESYPENAISVKGYSGAGRTS